MFSLLLRNICHKCTLLNEINIYWISLTLAQDCISKSTDTKRELIFNGLEDEYTDKFIMNATSCESMK